MKETGNDNWDKCKNQPSLKNSITFTFFVCSIFRMANLHMADFYCYSNIQICSQFWNSLSQPFYSHHLLILRLFCPYWLFCCYSKFKIWVLVWPKHVYKSWRSFEENFLFCWDFFFDWDILLRNKFQLIICWFSQWQHTAP